MKKYFPNILKCKFLFIQLFLFGKQCKVLLMKPHVDFFCSQQHLMENPIYLFLHQKVVKYIK